MINRRTFYLKKEGSRISCPFSLVYVKIINCDYYKTQLSFIIMIDRKPTHIIVLNKLNIV